MRRKHLDEGSVAFGMMKFSKHVARKYFRRIIGKKLGFYESFLNPFLEVQWKRSEEDSVAPGIQIDEYAKETFGRRQCGIRDDEIFETPGAKIFLKDKRKKLGCHELNGFMKSILIETFG